MPKLKPTATEMMNREVRASLKAGQERRAMSDENTAKYIGMCTKTYQKKKRSPDLFTIGDLRNLVKVFKVPDSDLLRMIREE